MSENKNPSKNRSRPQQRRNLSRDILHVSIQGHDHSLPSHIDDFELRELFSQFDSEVKRAVIISSSQLKAGKVSFKSIPASSKAREALHGKKLPDGSCLNVRYWRKEEDDEKQFPMTPGACLLTPSDSNNDKEDPVLRTLYVKITESQSPNVQSVNKRHLQFHFDSFKNDIESIVGILNGSNGEFAFVRFNSRKVASEAISCLNGSILCGRVLYVSFKRVKPKQKDVTVTVPRKEPILSGLRRAMSSTPVESTGATFTVPRKEAISSVSRKRDMPVGLKGAAGAKSNAAKILKHEYDQIILGSFYEPICTSSEIVSCKQSLLDHFKAMAVCSCDSSPGTSVVSQACLQVSQSRVVTIKIVVGSLITEKGDAVVIPTDRAVSASSYPIAMERPSLITSRFPRNLQNNATELVEIGETACLKAEHLSCSHIIQVLFPSREQMSADNLSHDEVVRNSLTHASQMRFGSVAFPGIKSQMVSSLVACLPAISSATLHTVSIVLQTESEAKMYSTALDLLIPSSGNESKSKSKKSYSEKVQGPTSATALQSPIQQLPSSSDFVWSWRENNGSFIPYTPAVTKALNDAYKQDINSTSFFTIDGTTYSVNFKAMKQTNLLTHGERTIKKSISNNDYNSVIWKYRDDYDCFASYSPGDSAQIEKMFQNGDESSFLVINKRTYGFDFAAMKQINVNTGYERDIAQYKLSSSTIASAEPSKPAFLCNGEVIVNIKGPSSTLAAAKQMLDSKLKSLLFSKTIPYPAGSNQSLLSRILAVAKKHKVSCTVGEGGESGASNVSKQVLTIQGLQALVEKAQTEMQELILNFHVSFDQLPKPDKSDNQYPQEWAAMSPQEQVKFATLSRSSSEFNRVRRRFEETMDQNNYVITKIQQVQNKYLWTRYQQSKVRLHNKDPLMVNEKELFHGTRSNPAETISSSEEGFDMRFSREGMWGQANYFAVKAKYSDTYSYHDNDKQTNEMILAKVLTGDSYSCSPDSSLRMPPLKKQEGAGAGKLQQVRYDSVNGVTHGSQIFMTYANDFAYPAFIITYTPTHITATPRPIRVAPIRVAPPPQSPPPRQPPPLSRQPSKPADSCTIS